MEFWALRLERPLSGQERAALLLRLPPQRRTRLERVVDDARWEEPLCAYALLRRALWARYHWKTWPALTLAPTGKPFFSACPNVHFNISHTRGAVLVGIDGSPVGVDIEKIRSVSPRLRQRLANGASETEFFQTWVRREARVKRTGEGIGTLLSASEEPLRPGEYYQALELFDGFAAGAAAGSPVDPEAVRLCAFQELFL